MRNTTIRYATAMAALAFFAFNIFTLSRLTDIARQRQQQAADLAYARNAKFGLFNADIWRRAIADIAARKIDQMAADPAARYQAQAQVEAALNDLIDEIARHLNQDRRRGNPLEQILKSVAYGIVFDADAFKRQTPKWAAEVLARVNTTARRDELKAYIVAQLTGDAPCQQEIERQQLAQLMQEKYGCAGMEECAAKIEADNSRLARRIRLLSLQMIAAAALALALWPATPRPCRTAAHYFAALGGVATLLLGGLLTPMIDLDARLGALQFDLLGQAMRFDDQVLFFQSKSVYDVVELLLREGDAPTIAVGALIFTFSVIFPTLKMAASALAYPCPALVRRWRPARFFALQSGKWSMADVMVMATAMSYIGFRSLVGSQLALLAGAAPGGELTTHKCTSLQSGFFLFAAFCLAGIAFAYIAQSRLNDSEKGPAAN